MTWLVALQALLFGAYGFSLAAEATARAKCGNDTDAVVVVIGNSRIAFATVGIASSIAILAALFAAIRSIHRLAEQWIKSYHNVPVKIPDANGKEETFDILPLVVGNYDKTIFGGVFLGQTPLVLIPFFCAVVWAVLLWDSMVVRWVLALVVGPAALAFWIYWFYWLDQDWSK